MDGALNALVTLRGIQVAPNNVSQHSDDIGDARSSHDNEEHSKSGLNLIAPSEWKGVSALFSIATLTRFTSPPPEAPAQSLLALASSKIRMSSANVVSEENMLDHKDEDFDPVVIEENTRVDGKQKKREDHETATKASLMVVVQGGVMGAKLTKEVVIVIDALCGTILKAPTYHSQKMCEYALDCVAVLITNGYVYGTVGLVEDAPPPHPLSVAPTPSVDDESSKNVVVDSSSPVDEADGLVSSTEILEFLIMTICKCSDMSWSSVQEGMVKVLLALVISPRCSVHGATLLKIVRSVFHVFLVTKSSTVKALAKDALMNITSAVFNRMEAYDAISRDIERSDSAKDDSPTTESLDLSNSQQPVTLADELQNVDQISINDSSLFDDDNVEEEDVDILKAVTSLRMNQEKQIEKYRIANAAFASQFHTDGYLLFRAICKLSSKSLPEDNMEGSLYLRKFGSGGITDPLAFQTKLLSLNMLIHMFEHSDTVFINGERFIYGIQQYLCVSLLKNCMSLHTDVGHAALKIFLILVSVTYPLKCHIMMNSYLFS